MKVLWVGPYRDNTGYGSASCDYVLALDEAGVDVVCRPLKLNDRNYDPGLRLRQLESGESGRLTHVVQHCLPHQMDYHGGLYNIGLFASETSDFRSSNWADRLNLMDEVWVINNQQVGACRDSGVSRPIRVVPHATDVGRFQRSYETLTELEPFKQAGEFLFYAIGEMVRRKNHAALLKAFYTEFDVSEAVRLVVKTDLPGKSSEEMRRHVDVFGDEIRRGLKLRGEHKQIVWMFDRMRDEELLRLHASCDCFVLPSYGEAWGIPAFDAMAMGKTPIVTAGTGALDWLDDDCGWLVQTHEEQVFGAHETFADLMTGDEYWHAVDIRHLRACMREAFVDRTKREAKARRGMERAYYFSRGRIGALMKGFLDDPMARTARPRARPDAA